MQTKAIELEHDRLVRKVAGVETCVVCGGKNTISRKEAHAITHDMNTNVVQEVDYDHGYCTRCGAQEEINPFTGGVWSVTIEVPVR